MKPVRRGKTMAMKVCASTATWITTRDSVHGVGAARHLSKARLLLHAVGSGMWDISFAPSAEIPLIKRHHSWKKMDMRGAWAVTPTGSVVNVVGAGSQWWIWW